MLTIKKIESRIAEMRPTQILLEAGKPISHVGTGAAAKQISLLLIRYSYVD